MPSIGTPAWNIACGARGEVPSVRLAGPPDRMMPRGRHAAIRSGSVLNGQISQYTPDSRSRRAISWVTWLPKSRISTRSTASAAVAAGSGRESGIGEPQAMLDPRRWNMRRIQWQALTTTHHPGHNRKGHPGIRRQPSILPDPAGSRGALYVYRHPGWPPDGPHG